MYLCSPKNEVRRHLGNKNVQAHFVLRSACTNFVSVFNYPEICLIMGLSQNQKCGTFGMVATS